MEDQLELETESKCAAEDSVNEAIFDMFEVADDMEEFSLAVCW